MTNLIEKLFRFFKGIFWIVWYGDRIEKDLNRLKNEEIYKSEESK